MRERIIWIGIILLVFGMALTALSRANLYYWEEEHRDPIILTIDTRSSLDYMLLIAKTAELKELEVKIYWFPRLDILNGSLNYSRPDHPYTVTLYEGAGSHTISRTFDWKTSPVSYVFDIPEDWVFLYKITLLHYDDHPICLVGELTLSRQILDSDMETASHIGLVSAVLGILLISAGTLLRSRSKKQEEGKGIGALIAKRRSLRFGVPMAQGRIKLYVKSVEALVGVHTEAAIDRTSEWKGIPKYGFVLPDDQEPIVLVVRELCETYGFELTVIDVARQDGFHKAITRIFEGIREYPTIVSGSGRRIEGNMSKDQVDAFLSKEKQTWV